MDVDRAQTAALPEVPELTPFEVETLRACLPEHGLDAWKEMERLLGDRSTRQISAADRLWSLDLVDSSNDTTPAGRAVLAAYGVLS